MRRNAVDGWNAMKAMNAKRGRGKLLQGDVGRS